MNSKAYQVTEATEDIIIISSSDENSDTSSTISISADDNSTIVISSDEAQVSNVKVELQKSLKQEESEASNAPPATNSSQARVTPF